MELALCTRSGVRRVDLLPLLIDVRIHSRRWYDAIDLLKELLGDVDVSSSAAAAAASNTALLIKLATCYRKLGQPLDAIAALDLITGTKPLKVISTLFVCCCPLSIFVGFLVNVFLSLFLSFLHRCFWSKLDFIHRSVN